jgi:DNA polymerase III subunit gamma/tau
MGQALYRKYRSKSLSEIVGQEHIIMTLQNALKKGSISHAYLFTGPRGVGKTSIARILAHEINGLDYDETTPHIDIIEIDAASNRRIDEIRDLRDKVHIAPTSSKYKVYIIDEVHMLTKEAFNALLKTLEEPPAHVIFILATTESHKLPETIISRTQHFTFKPIDSTKAVEHLREIAKKEKLQVSDEALELLAEHGDGSFRDSIGLLDQISSQGSKIEADDVRAMLGIAPATTVQALYEETLSGSPKAILTTLQAVHEQGYEPSLIARQLAQTVRAQILDDSPHAAMLTNLLNQLIDVPASSDPAAKLEVILLGVNLQQTPQASPVVAAPAKVVPQSVSKADAKVESVVAEVVTPKPPAQKIKPTDDFMEAWANVLTAVKKQYNTLYGVLRMAQPTLDGDNVTLACQYPFHQKRLKEPKNRQIIADLLTAQLGRPVKVECTVDKKSSVQPIQTPSTDVPAPALDAISNIFGATEVLES